MGDCRANGAVEVVYCGDACIADGLLISALSLVRATSRPLVVHVATAAGYGREALSEKLCGRLEAVLARERPSVSVVRHDMTGPFAANPPHANARTRFTPFCMLRLYLDYALGLPGRVLYLDNDVICRNDLDVLWDTDLAGNEFAGVLDYYGSVLFRRNPPHRDYVNSGVLLMDLDLMSESGLFCRCRELCARTRMLMPDQSALNRLATRKLILPRRFNEQHRLMPDTAFQHFTTQFRFFPIPRTVTVKPWQVERVHDVLGLHEYDTLLADYRRLRDEVAAGC